MKLYDSLSAQAKEVNSQEVKIYACGPTVYDYLHIGNARPLILVDILIRYFEHRKCKYKYLLNITDIDDKIIEHAMKENTSEEEYAQKYTNSFLNDLDSLNIKSPSEIIPISEKINEIIDFVSDLLDKDYAYEVEGNVYFDITKWKDEYGKLSKQNLDQLNLFERIEPDKNKKNPRDFILWKKTDIGKRWHSKWSFGRPGWHTECALLIHDFFGETIDIHVGGSDLKFPHHENERIQFMARNLCEISKIWIHNGHLSLDDIKMSKSLNNTILIKDFVKNYGGDALRYIFLTSNYKQPLNITQELIDSAVEWVGKMTRLLRKVNWLKAIGEVILTNQTPIDEDFNSYKYITKFRSYIDEFLNTPMVISLVDEMAKSINKQISTNKIDLTYSKLTNILKVLGFNFKIKNLNQEDIAKIKKWLELKNNNNFEEADKLRILLQQEKII